MRNDVVFKRAYNEHLTILASGEWTVLGPERQVAARFSASRTTVRKCRAALVDAGILGEDNAMLRLPAAGDYFHATETTSAALLVEREFLKWILQSDSRPGQVINASRLAREFGTSTTTVREFLQSFQHFGLLERQSGGGWVLRGMTVEFANELSDIREIFEIKSVLRFAQIPSGAEYWERLREIRAQHVALLATIEVDFHSFSLLDEKLHRLINAASSNRFVTEFHQVISLIFFYHYQWNKRDERERNEAAIHQHLDYIDAIVSRDPVRITESCTRHLQAARQTLLDSLY